MNYKIGTNCSRKTGLKFICENTRYELCAGQKKGMKKLYEGDDVALVAMHLRTGEVLRSVGPVGKAIPAQFF